MKKIILLFIVVGIVCSSKAQCGDPYKSHCQVIRTVYGIYSGPKREIGEQDSPINDFRRTSGSDSAGGFFSCMHPDSENSAWGDIPITFGYDSNGCRDRPPDNRVSGWKYIKIRIWEVLVNISLKKVSSFKIHTDELEFNSRLNKVYLNKKILEKLPQISGKYLIQAELPLWVESIEIIQGRTYLSYRNPVVIGHKFNFSPVKLVAKKPINQIPSHVSWDVINKDASYVGVKIFIAQKNIVNGEIQHGNGWACYNHDSNNFTSPTNNPCRSKDILDKDLRSLSLKDVPFKAGKHYSISIEPLVRINGSEPLRINTAIGYHSARITFNVPDDALIYKGLKFYSDDDSSVSVEASSENPLNLIDVGKKISFKIAVKNFGTILTNLKGTLTSTQSGVTILKNKVGFDSISSQEKSFSTEEFEIIADDTVVPGTELLFDLSLKNGFNNTELAKTSLSFPIQPFISETDLIDDDGTNNSKGNDNKIFELGETIEYRPFVSNVSKHIFYGVIGTLNSNQSPVEVWHAKEGKSGRMIEKYTSYNSTSTGQAVSPGEKKVQPINPFVIDYTGNTPLQNISFELQVEGNINIKEGTLMRCSALKTIKSEGEGDGSKETASEIINLPITGNKIYTGQSFEIANNGFDFNMNSINQIEEGIFEIKKTVEGKLSVKAIKHGSYSFTIGANKNGENRNYTYNITTNLKYGLEIIPTN